ncbi:MAG: ribose-5-phosphate isomerase RpiA [Spirochaetia bacterium]|nr:ribose-5-phosphate isomerase RpiA [Spirochaetota bacterium]MCX8096854.1 ribose-5-phosphate isomerase RpiA [Spirochaetota bacterium]MDW8111788.1 ribose-5-phosphate isomerase RpiA [Spirochaetia bacterium]
MSSLPKVNVAMAALDYVKSGMIIGLGSGTTVQEFIKLLGQRVKEGLNVVCVTTSYSSRMLAIQNGIFVTETDAVDRIDIAIDGADKANKEALLKGGGGALTREKIIDYNANEFVVIVDESKIVDGVLEGVVNMEVLPFAAPIVMKELKEFNPTLRVGKGKLGPVVSDNGNFLLECYMRLENPKETERWLKSIPGIIENGIFTKFSTILVGTETGWFRFV